MDRLGFGDQGRSSRIHRRRAVLSRMEKLTTGVTRRALRPLSATFVIFAIVPALFAGQPLETESARLLPPGAIKIETVVEFQTSADGRETALPFLFEAGLSHDWELTLEPVPYTSIRPAHSRGASGPGDLEVTLTHLLSPENSSHPAFAVAAEVKLPTAKSDLIGTGKADYAVLWIASKRFGILDTHFNLGYTFTGSPAGANLGNIVNYAIGATASLQPKLSLVGEIIGNTSSSPDKAEGDAGGGAVTPEAAGGETSALIGLQYKVSSLVGAGLGVSYDNNSAFLVRAGLTFRFGRR